MALVEIVEFSATDYVAVVLCSPGRNPRLRDAVGQGTYILRIGISNSIPARTTSVNFTSVNVKDLFNLISLHCSVGRALKYGANFTLKYFLPAADLKYRSLAIASFLVGNSSKYASSNGMYFLIDLVIPELCCFNLDARSSQWPL